MNKRYAIAITVYKDRYSQFLTNLDKIDKKYDILIVSQTNDPNKNDYDKYVVSDNIKVLIVDVKDLTGTRALAFKRDYLIDYTKEHGYSGFINVDDDVNFNAFRITPEDLRQSGKTYKFNKCNFNLMLNRMCEVAEEYNAGIVGVTRWGYLGFQKPGKVNVNTSLNPSQFYFVNTDILTEKNIRYNSDGYVVEDFDLTLRLLQNGINCCNVCDYMFNTTNVATVDSSNSCIWENVDDIIKSRMHFYIKYHAPLKIDRHGNIGQTINWKKYFNTFELPPIKDKELYELAKQEDIQATLEFLQNNYGKKD